MTSAPSGGTPAKRPEDGRQLRLRPQPWWLTFLVVMGANPPLLIWRPQLRRVTRRGQAGWRGPIASAP